MFFFTQIKKEVASVAAVYKTASRCNHLFMLVLLALTTSSLSANVEAVPDKSWSHYVPHAWQESIIMPSLHTSMSIFFIGPAASGIPGHSDVILRYIVKNDGLDTLNCIQIAFDIKNQIGVPPFVALTGSLSAMTGSGFIFGGTITGSTSMVYGGTLNVPSYDGMMNDTVFNTLPSLNPDQCISIDIPFEITDTSGIGPVIVSATTTGKTRNGIPVSSTSLPLTIVRGCESVSLACAGRVNVSLGPDCKAFISLNSVFLNSIPDTSRFTVEVFHNGVSLGNMLDESHVGKALTYSVLDGCFNNTASCWGTIVLENKNLPRRSSTYQEIFCGEDPDPIGTLEEIIEDIQNDCFINITSFQEIYDITGNKCDGYITTRVVLGEYTIDGWKSRDTVHVDTIVENPLDIDMLEPPLGGPDSDDAIYVNCDSLYGLYPTPAFIENYYDNLPAFTGSGTAYAYPHIDQGFISMEMYNSRDTIIEEIRDTTLLIDSIWVDVRFVFKDTVTITDTSSILKPDLVAIKSGTTCNLTVNYVDSYFPGCVGPESKILRSWKILNWCTGELQTLEQWIIIEDDRGPDINMPDTVNVNIAPWTCLAEYQLFAEVEDNCSQIRSLNWKASAGIIGEDFVLREITLSDSPVIVELQAVDECGNDSTKVLVIHIIDSVPPVAIARDQLNTNLTYDQIQEKGLAKITADAINLESHDSGCGPVNYCILLDEELSNPIVDEFGSPVQDSLGNQLYHAVQCEIDGFYKGDPYVICKDAVKFCCDQVGQHRVALIVNDESEVSPPAYSWTLVNVEDKSFPIVNCENITVTCGTDFHPDVIGYPELTNGFCNNAILSYQDDEKINDCGLGKINRTWLVNGDSACVQMIFVEGSSQFDPKSIKWPKHHDNEIITGVIRECVNDTIYEWEGEIFMGFSFICSSNTADEPVWCETTCSMLFKTYEDVEVQASEACKKIIRKWTVIDWCAYQPNSNNVEADDDTFEAVSDKMITTPNIKGQLKEGDLCESCDKPSSQNSDDIFFRYTNVDVDGFYNFDQIIKIVDDTPPVVDAPEEVVVEISLGARTKDDDFDDCIGNTNVSALAIDLCGDFALDASSVRWLIEVHDEDGNVLETEIVFGDSAVINSQNGMGNTEHTIYWYVTDACGNEASATTTVVFKDILDPTPLCISELSTATMNVGDGGVTIWASDYDHGSWDNCSDVKVFFRNEEGFATSSLTFTCEDIPDGISTIKQILVYVADEAGNESSCNVSIRLDDNNNVCIDSLVGEAQIAGQFMTFKGDMIEAANALLNGAQNQLTDVNGTYVFNSLPMASSYKIEGLKNDDPLNGVTTLDLVLIQRHILALDIFDSPYKVIAADINSDTRVSALDLVQLRRLLLGYTDDFPLNQSWRFINPEIEIPNPLNPWPFVEALIVYDLAGDMDGQDLLGIKIGDVSGNAIANSLLAKSRNSQQLNFKITDQLITKGSSVVIPVSINEKNLLAALQFTMETNSLIIEEVVPGELNISSAHYAIHANNVMTLAWSSENSLETNDALFSIRLKANKDILLSDAINITNRITEAKAYDSNYDGFDISLDFDMESANSASLNEFELMQNVPNPFSESTSIGFTINESGNATLSLTDISGRLIYQLTDSYNKGYNEIQLTKEDISARGVIYYKLETANNTQTRKMILIE